MIGTEWAKPVLTQSIASTPPWNFQQMYTALDAAWLQEQKQTESRKRDPLRTPSMMPTLPAYIFKDKVCTIYPVDLDLLLQTLVAISLDLLNDLRRL